MQASSERVRMLRAPTPSPDPLPLAGREKSFAAPSSPSVGQAGASRFASTIVTMNATGIRAIAERAMRKAVRTARR